MLFTIVSCVLIGCLVHSAPLHKQSSVITISVQSEGAELSCVYREATYNEGQEFNDGSCKRCRCEGSVVICQETTCPRIHNCDQTHIPEGSCCPVCSDGTNETVSLVEFCVHNSHLYQMGAKWQSDSCTQCECDTGSVVRCSAQECSVTLPCWETEENNNCCPVCKVTACNTRNGLKRDGEVWTEGQSVLTCRDHLVTTIDCQSVCSNQPLSMECAECRSIEPATQPHTCGDRNMTYHETEGCISVRPLPLATTSCPQECTTDNNNAMCCEPVIKNKLIRHSCGNQGNKMVSVPVVTRCSCHRC